MSPGVSGDRAMARSLVITVVSAAIGTAALRLLGLPRLLAITVVALWFLLISLDRLLGRLAGLAIGRTPKAFRWTIECICVRPSFSWGPHAWSEVIVLNWTWHNPQGFNQQGADGEPMYILQVDRLTLRLELASIYRAVRYHKAVQVDMLLLEGVRFKMHRNEEAALNLWEALDLPDSDVNVSAIVQKAKKHGGMLHFDRDRKSWSGRGAASGDSTASIMPLPPVATDATRKAARYWRKEWGQLKRKTLAYQAMATKRSQRWWPCRCSCECLGGSNHPAASEPQRGAYFEYPIGDPRRRPRWGVPVRLDIRQMAVVGVQLWIFDLLTMDHRWRLLSPTDTKMAVSSLFISRESLEAGDERRSGHGEQGDGIRGVYLGELIWVLIAQLLPKVVEQSPSNLLKTAAFAAGFAARDGAVTAGAKVLDLAIETRHILGRKFSPALMPSSNLRAGMEEDSCRVQVHLMRGRGVAHQGQRVSVLARLELRDPPFRGTPVDRAESALRVWTKTPLWDQHFSLGPAGSVQSVLRVALFCRNTRYGYEPFGSSKCDAKIGEVVISLSTLLVRDKVIDNMMVGWFPLETPSGTAAPRFKGRLKLGLKLVGQLPEAAEV